MRTSEMRSRLRTRRGLLVSALPIVLVIALAGIVLAIGHRDSGVDDRKEETQALAEAAASNAGRFVTGQFAVLRTVVSAPIVRHPRRGTNRFLQRVNRAGRFTTTITLLDAGGRVRFSSAPVVNAGLSLADRPYVQAALRGREAVSPVLVGRSSGSPLLAFGQPVLTSAGRQTGVLVGTLRLDTLSTGLDRLLYARDAGEYLVDDADHLIVGSRPVRGLERPPAAIELRRRTGTTDGDIDGRRRLIGYAPVPGTAWTAAVNVDHGDTIGRLDRALALEIVALLVLAAAGVLGTLAAARRLDRLERARDQALQEQSHIAAQLQRSMLPGLPVLAGVDLEARYAPAQSGLAVGGDWYDVVDLGDGVVAGSIGDVAGHGLASAAVMGQLRSAVRSLSLSGRHPGDALTELDRFTALVDGRPLATVVCVRLDTKDGTLRYACAGHPPPLLVRADGEAEFLHGGRSPLLGIAPGEARDEGVAELRPGDTLLAYTDGLIERTDASIDDGMDALQARATALGPAPAALARELLAAVAEPRRDDVAILCLRLAGARQPSVAS